MLGFKLNHVDKKDPVWACATCIFDINLGLNINEVRKIICKISVSWQISLRPVRKIASKWWHSWWRHQMEIFSALLAICAGNSPVTGEFPTQRPVTRSFDVYFDLRPKERLSKQWWGWWFETLSRSLWRHRNVSFIVLHHMGFYSLYRRIVSRGEMELGGKMEQRVFWNKFPLKRKLASWSMI